MLFTDPIFLFLLMPLACVLFYGLTPKWGPSAGLGLLLVISLLFYLPWGLFYFFLLAASITVNFISAYFILTLSDQRRGMRRAALALGLLYNFASLGWFKYRLPLFYAFGAVPSAQNFTLVDIAVPIGISFYTFQQAIFLVDAYHRDQSVVAYLGNLRQPWGKLRGYVHHAFFVTFFPHLVIGPIVYLSEFQPQVENQQFGRLRVRNLEVGLTLIAIGMFKKIVLADNLAPLADRVFTAADIHAGIPVLMSWAGALAYYMQLYFDFSGYSDMAIGTARLLGVRFPMNFFSPLKAVGIIDFYRRWHITLTRVIARFLYTPMSMSGARLAARYKWGKMPSRVLTQWLPLLINFEVIGLWHGARITFVVFGLIHGTWYVLESEIRASKLWKAWRKKVPDLARAFLGRMIFTIPMLLTFALFRSSSVASFGYLLTKMFAGAPSLNDISFDTWKANLAVLAVACGVAWLMPNAMEFLRSYRPGIATYANKIYGIRPLIFAWRPNVVWTAVVAGMFVSAMYFISRQPPFLYMGF